MVERLVRWSRAAVEHPRATVLAGLLLTAACAALAAARLRVDNEIDSWLPRGDAAIARYEAFRDTFGSDALFVVGCTGVPVDGPGGERVAELQETLAALPGVARVVGPFDAAGRPEAPAAAFLLSGDRGAAAFLVHPEAGLDRASRARLFEDIAGLAHAGPGELHVAGPEAINHHLDVGSRRSFGGLFPVVATVLALALLLALRDPRGVAAVLLLAAASTAGTLGALALAGRSLNMVVSSLPALLLVAGTVASLHLLDARLRQQRAGGDGAPGAVGADDAAAWGRALGEMARPCLYTAATTAAGLGALALAPLPPLRDLGLFGALGMLVNGALVLFLFPSLTRLLGGGRTRAAVAWAGAGALAACLGRPAVRRSILGAALVVAVVGAAGVARLRVESDVLTFFPADHAVVTATRELEERVQGLTPVEIWFSGPAGAVFSPPSLARAAALAAEIRALPGVTGLFGPSSPDASPAAWPGHLRLSAEGADVRWTVATRTTSIERSDQLVSRIEQAVAAAAVPGVEARVTGSMPILIRMQALLLTSAVRSFSASLGLVTVLASVAFRSVGTGLLSLVPNVLPVLATLGAMGFLGVPLDVATVTVASIALGLVVDDTIHFLEHYVRAGRAARAVETCLRRAGRPILISSLAVAAGFAAFAAAPFRPTVRFGVLVAATSVLALVCDLLVLPALLSLRSRCS